MTHAILDTTPPRSNESLSRLAFASEKRTRTMAWTLTAVFAALAVVVAALTIVKAVTGPTLTGDELGDALGMAAVELVYIALIPAILFHVLLTRDIRASRRLIRDAVAQPASITRLGRWYGGMRSIDVGWTEDGKTVGGHVDVAEKVDTAGEVVVLALPRSRRFAVVMGDQLFVGKRR